MEMENGTKWKSIIPMANTARTQVPNHHLCFSPLFLFSSIRRDYSLGNMCAYPNGLLLSRLSYLCQPLQIEPPEDHADAHPVK